MAKKMKVPPPGLDYCPVLGEIENLSFGIIQADEKDGGPPNTAEGAVFKRMYPILKPDDPKAPWLNPTCFRHSVLLPSGASDELWDAQRLSRTYDDHGYSLRDLIVMLTLRFPEAEATPPTLRLHEAWRISQGFVWDRIVCEYRAGAISVMHVPARNAGFGVPHVHVMIPARQLLPTGFGQFLRPLASEEGREIMEKAWTAWWKENGLG
jgi:hypothetical protein